MLIEILDPVHSRIVPKSEQELILPCLCFYKYNWTQGQYGKEKTLGKGCVIQVNAKYIPTGLVPRIAAYCKEVGISLSVQNSLEYLEPERPPNLPGIKLREDQSRIVQSVIEDQRGIISSATGTGKTVLAGAICSVWPSKRVVFLCHTLDLLQQATRRFKEQFKFDNVVSMGGGQDITFNWPKKPTIVVATVQTYKLLDYISHSEWADIIILDEAHHLSHRRGMFANVLDGTQAPVRIGLTATPPKEGRELLVIEGWLGPIIGEFTYSEGVEAGILAKPLIDLIAVPWSDSIGDLSRYKDIYRKGIVENRVRNRLIIEEASKSIAKGHSVLILTADETDHGKRLQAMAEDVFDLDIPFVYGKVNKKIRQQLQDDLDAKKLLAVIANKVWVEGMDVPSLNHVINATGGLRERRTLQILGRGSRAIAGKSTFKLTDFLDPYNFLARHTVARLIVYAEEGWLNYGI